MDIQVGDKVTHKSVEEPDEEAREYIIKDEHQLADIISCVIKNEIEILKIERPKYELIEEKKELLTDEEKEFLKHICKYYDVDRIDFHTDGISFYDKDYNELICFDNSTKLLFNNIRRSEEYTLKELGLEE